MGLVQEQCRGRERGRDEGDGGGGGGTNMGGQTLGSFEPTVTS